MNIQKLWNEKSALISINIASTVLICVFFLGGLTVVNANKGLIDLYSNAMGKVQQQHDTQKKKDALLNEVIQHWYTVGDTIASNDTRIAFCMKVSWVVLIGGNFISLYYLLRRRTTTDEIRVRRGEP